MTTQIATIAPVFDLVATAAAINRHHDAAEVAARTAIEHAFECGQLLIQAKEHVEHGGWLPWLEKNTRMSARTAQRYMRVTQATIEGKYDAASHLTIEGVLDVLAAPKGSESPLDANGIIHHPSVDTEHGRTIALLDVPVSLCDPNPFWPSDLDCNLESLSEYRRIYRYHPSSNIGFSARRVNGRFEIEGPRYRWLAIMAERVERVLIFDNKAHDYSVAEMLEAYMLDEMFRPNVIVDDIRRAASVAYPYLSSIGIAPTPEGLDEFCHILDLKLLTLALSDNGKDCEAAAAILAREGWAGLKRTA